MASDYRDFGFAKDYGVLIEEMGLLSRAVFVLTKQGKIAYIQKVPEIAQEPMYAPILAVAKELLKGKRK
jgi:thiol peroxidase